MYPLDLNKFAHKGTKTPIVTKSRKPPRHKKGEKFLKGPIPWKWITKAAQLGGKSLQVAMAIWFQAGLTNRRTVKLSNSVLKALGTNRFAKSRGLRELEESGLVSVIRENGRSPIVTIEDID